MKIVIEIPDIKYQWIKDNPLTYDNEYCEAIRNGTPLDKIRAEIEQITDTMRADVYSYKYCPNCGAKMSNAESDL